MTVRAARATRHGYQVYMAIEAMALSGLARRLVDDELIDPETAARSATDARRAAMPLVSYLVRNDIVNARAVAERASDAFGVPLFDLSVIDRDAIPRGLVKEQLIRRHNALPLIRRGTRLFVGCPTRRTCRVSMRSNSRPASTPRRCWSRKTSFAT